MENKSTLPKFGVMLDMLSDMVINYSKKFSEQPRSTKLSLSEWKYLLRLMQKEDEEWSEFELTAELLGTREFVILS